MKRSTLGVHQFNQAVGAVVLLCVALFIGALLNAGLLKEWFQTSLTLRIVLPEEGTSGLSQGSEVQILGTRAGEIRRIVIDPSQRMHAEARIDTQMKPFIRRDSQVVIRRQFGIAGNAYIDITRGRGPELDWGFAVLTANSDRAPTDSIGQVVDDVRSRIVPILDQLQKVVASASDLVGPAGALHQTLQSTATVAQRVERGEGSVGKLLADDKMATDLAATLAAAQSAVAHTNGLVVELEKNAKDAKIASILQRTDAILASLQIVTKNLAAASPNITSTTDSMPALLLQTESAARELELLLVQLRRSWLLGGGGGATPASSRRAPASEVRP
jgi:phospholipid/cholesterol/gamma-HCH transport system substrate-binding protein